MATRAASLDHDVYMLYVNAIIIGVLFLRKANKHTSHYNIIVSKQKCNRQLLISHGYRTNQKGSRNGGDLVSVIPDTPIVFQSV